MQKDICRITNELMESGRISIQNLNSIINEIKEENGNIHYQKKYLKNILSEKEKELKEKERTLVHNADVFSANDKSKEGLENDVLKDQILEIQNKINDLDISENKLNDRLIKVESILQCMENYYEIVNINEDDMINIETIRNVGINILDSQEQERQRIAMDLHDTAVQNLTGLIHKIELCIKLIDIDTVRTKLELSSMTNIIRLIISDMRNTIYNLKPMTLDDLGLNTTIERFARNIMDTSCIKVNVNCNNEELKIDHIIKLTIFRVIREACQNVIKHANATIIDIDLKCNEKEISFNIKDNGDGFDIQKQKCNDSKTPKFGISDMKERIILLSGKFEIHSEKGIGTIVSATVPITKY